LKIKRTINPSASNTETVQWWLDASFAIFKDICSHTGGNMMLGRGAVFASSTRQKINSKSSTEAELAGVTDLLGQVL